MAHVVGLVFICFGLIASYILNVDLYYFSAINLLLGAVCIAYYLLRGGRFKGGNLLKTLANLSYPALFIAVIFLANLLITKHDPIYFDSTSQKVYSLAPQTQELLKNLKSQVLIRAFYLGGQLDPSLKSLIEKMKKITSNIELQVIDPSKSPQLAEKFGISERSTLHISIKDQTRAIKLVRSAEEQDLTNAILKLIRGEEKKIYWLGGDFEDKSQTGYLFLKEAIQGENLNLENLDLLSKLTVPKDAAALILMPLNRELLQTEQNAITDYINSGGNAIICTNPKFAEFVSLYGLSVGNNVVLDEIVKLAEGPTLVMQPVISDFNQHPITEKFKEGIILTTANSVSKAIDAEIKFPNIKVTELAFTGEKSWAETNLKLIFSDNPQASFDKEDKKGPISIAAAVEAKGKLVVIGDADFVNNLNIRQLFNRDFFLNSLNWVIGEKEALNIRASSIQGSTRRISDSQMKSIFLFSGLIFPELIILTGLFLWWRRK